MVVIKVKQNESTSGLLKRFNLKSSEVLKELEERRFYKKPSQIKQEKEKARLRKIREMEQLEKC